MNDMPPKHAIPAAPEPKRRDHLWVLFVIAACVLAEVWASWVGIGSISGFPVILGKVPTDWVLAVAMEAYWGYALYAWLVASPGPRSRAMAMWSCAVVFAFSLAGQVLYHELTVPPGTPPGRRVVIGFVTSLPVVVLALIAILIHLRHADREEAAEAQRRVTEAARLEAQERAEADERTALRRQLAELRAGAQAEIEAARAERETALRQAQEAAQAAAESAAQISAMGERQAEADRELAELRGNVSALEEARDTTETALAEATRRAEGAEAKAERLTRKLGPNSGTGRNRNSGAKDSAKSRTTVPNDVDARAQALSILLQEPGITGKELGERCGRGERWGQLRKSELAGHVADGTGSTEGGAE